MFVSVIVPNFNHKRFLPQRLDSIFNQTFENFEVILLDDCSTDGSWEYLQLFLKHPKVSFCLRNDKNSGSPFRQWVKGIESSKGDLIWIAESDDFSDLVFLETCVPYFDDHDVSLVVSSSVYVDGNSKKIDGPMNTVFKGKFSGNEFVNSYMYFNNSILNASSVVFRKSLVKSSTLIEITDFRLSGDYLFWIELIKGNSLIALDCKLNFFRWHNTSVRFQESNKLTGLLEGVRIKKKIEKNFQIDKSIQTICKRKFYLDYFKFLKHNKHLKDWNEFIFVLHFFLPVDRFKAFVRFFIM
ncbi:glycosyltransferase family 2 protein [Algoriphagus lacus]|uniref:Glycosyltransferase family 2 protein n=1 Tax=Algoriphagus lacus TaxID=2056311 RepID=A0A418PMV8_9BACT|nr:glycosyltransferase family 2 protein [Algoriphagus lacus]RIW13082.1 glycosyltransferase family 2 protein [Algoriphagus lacus]